MRKLGKMKLPGFGCKSAPELVDTVGASLPCKGPATAASLSADQPPLPMMAGVSVGLLTDARVREPVYLCTESSPYSISSPVTFGTKCSIPNILLACRAGVALAQSSSASRRDATGWLGMSDSNRRIPPRAT
jgi:hypothetical protein